jgi:hypothetical protein
MNIEEFPPHELFTGIELKFSGTRVLNDTLSPASFCLKLELHPMDEDMRDGAISDSYVKMKYFVDQALDGAVFIERMDEWSAVTFIDLETGLPTCANNLVMCPGRPTNISLAKVLHAKLAALACDSIHVGFVQLNSNDAGGLGVTSVGEAATSLPTMEEWLGQERSYFSKPWWSRDDASTMDIVPGEDANLAQPPEFAYSLAFLLEEPEEIEGEPKVVRLEFRPRLIQGGKQD